MIKIKTRISFAICLITILFSKTVFGQKTIKDYVTKNTVSIKTIEPDSTNFTDLESIGKAIGNSRIVILGEQDHGDARTFTAKTRLIKYLREEKGFSVLAFESDFYGLNVGWDLLRKDSSSINDFLLKNIFGVWSVCNTCSDLLYKYIPNTYKTDSPLIVTGFDNQLYLNYSFNNLSKALDSVLRLNNLDIVKNIKYTSDIIPLIDSSKKWDFFPPKDTLRVNIALDYLREIKQQFENLKNPDVFWKLIIDSHISHIEGIKAKYLDNKRDNQMALNLKWLLEKKYKDKKVIVWAASSHVGKSMNSLKSSFYGTPVSMIEKLITNSNLESEMYVMGFSSYEGNSGRIGSMPYKIFKPKKNSFETWIDTSYNQAFVDFKEFNSIFPEYNENFFLSGFGHVSGEAKWNEVFDGIFYIKEMTPCVPIKFNSQ